MKFSRRAFLSALTAAVVFAACTPMRRTPLSTAGQTTVRVENRGFLDMTIYVLRGAERVRLGLATGASSTRFVIPADIASTVMPLRFIADPVGSSRASVSEEISVRPGDEVVLEIPPN